MSKGGSSYVSSTDSSLSAGYLFRTFRQTTACPGNMAWPPGPDDAEVFPVEPDTYVTSFVLLSEDNTPLSHVAIRHAVLHHRAISYRVYGISEAITHPAHRRRGYAAQLLRQAAAWIPQQGADLCLFTCAPSLVPLYSKNGCPPPFLGLVS